jgi:hypothetical protein
MRILRFARVLALALASSLAPASVGLGGAPLLAIAGVAGPVLLDARNARAETPVIYKWVDEHGIAHYTTDRNRIPSSLRDRVEQIGGSGTTRGGSDWLDLDAGQTPPPAASAAPNATQKGVAVQAPGEFQSGTPAPAQPPAAAASGGPAAPAAAPAGGVSAPGAQAPAAAAASTPPSRDTVDAYRAKPDYSAAPGGQAQYAPGDLGEPAKGKPDEASASAGPAAPRAAAPAEAPAAAAPSLAADGAPVDRPPASAPAPVSTAGPAAPAAADAGSPETQAPEPSAPAAVASRAPLTPTAATELHDIDQRIADLESRISKDEEALATLISTPDAERKEPLVDDAQFREIAQRLPKQQAELEKLREQRGRIQPAANAP